MKRTYTEQVISIRWLCVCIIFNIYCVIIHCTIKKNTYTCFIPWFSSLISLNFHSIKSFSYTEHEHFILFKINRLFFILFNGLFLPSKKNSQHSLSNTCIVQSNRGNHHSDRHSQTNWTLLHKRCFKVVRERKVSLLQYSRNFYHGNEEYLSVVVG